MDNIHPTIENNLNGTNPQQIPDDPVLHRPQNIMPASSEIASLWSTYQAETMAICNILSNLILNTMHLGMSQVVKDDDVRKFLKWGKKITEKQMKILSSFLDKEELPVPSTSDFEVSISTESPFSDRLIMFHVTVVTAYSILEYGISLTNTPRKDVAGAFSRCIVDLIHYAKDGTDIMIEKGWLERLPETADRGELLKKH